MIPKKLHIIWVGDESKRPDNCIRTWAEHHPDWELKIWGNASLREISWVNAAHMIEMSKRELNGVADMMRWEILYSEGGIVVDADSVCVRPLDPDLLNCDAFACWENEILRPGLIAAGYFGAVASNPFVGQIILDIRDDPGVTSDMAWKTVGPQRLTDSYRKYAYQRLRIFPSHYFIPEHFTGLVYDGQGPVYANQKWASTKRIYESLHLDSFDEAGKTIGHDSGVPAAGPTATGSEAAALPAAAAPAGDPANAPLAARHDPYFVQRVHVSSDLSGQNRGDVFKKLCAGKRVLHVGCADWPITDPKTSLHLALEPHCASLDGFDVHEEALAALAPYTRGNLYSRFEDLTREYDIVLVPEVMEHVTDVEHFLGQLHSLNAHLFVLTVPDAYQCRNAHFEYDNASQVFTEIVHPDHNCWYTPFTLSNVIAKYTPWKIEGMWFFNRISLLVMASKPGAA